MEAKVLLKDKNAIVISFHDGTEQQACIVSSSDVPADVRTGDIIDVADRAISNGTEYGIDWYVLLGGSIDVTYALQQELRRHNIWTLQDYQDNPQQVRGAIGTVVNGIHNRLQRAVINELTYQE